MTSISSRRPIFLNSAQRRAIIIRRYVLAVLILTPLAFASGYFFGG